MTVEAIIFMAVVWSALFGLITWSYAKVLRGRRHFDPDGIGPAASRPGMITDDQPPLLRW